MPEDLHLLFDRLRASPPLSTIQEQITRAALSLFAERGYEGTTTAALAQHAGITEKTLFKHFPSKQQLFARVVYPALLDMLHPLAFETLERVLSSPRPSLREALHAVILDRLQFVRRHPAVFKLIAQEFILRPEFRQPLAQFWQEHILPSVKALLKRARKQGDLATLPDELVIRSLLSLSIGYIFQTTFLMPGSRSKDEKQVTLLIDILLHGIAPPPHKSANKGKPS